MPYKVNETRRHRIPKARYRVENWAAYDAALRRRGDLTLWVTPEAIAAWIPPATGRRGRPARYSDVAIKAGLMLRLTFGRPWRQTEGLLGSLMRLLGLTLPVPDHTTFSRRSVALEVAAALARTDGPVSVVIASTGLKVFGKGEWRLEKYGGQARRSWRKLHLAVNPDTGEILALDLTRPSDTAKSTPTQRDDHIQRLAERGRLGWQRDVRYGRRSLGEVAMMRYKQLIGRSLRARSLPAQKVEAAVGCKVMNIMTSLGMPLSRKVA